VYRAIRISSILTTRLEEIVDRAGRFCGLRRVDEDLPATAVMTANAGSRSFWANIVAEIMLFSNFSNVSAAQLDDSMPAERPQRR
jgi:hypothetical protein